MRVSSRQHFAYRVYQALMAGRHWLTPLDDFRANFQPVQGHTHDDYFVQQVRLEGLIDDMFALAERVGWRGGVPIEPVYVFFLPDGYSPKFGLIWDDDPDEKGGDTFIVSPDQLPHIERQLVKEVVRGLDPFDVDVVPDYSLMSGPVRLPFDRTPRDDLADLIADWKEDEDE